MDIQEDRDKSEPRPKPTGRQAKWLGRLVLALLAPILCFGVLEFTLRCGGYGHPTPFFIRAPDPGTYVTNRRFTWRFMSPERAWGPIPQEIASRKTENTYRIFVLGGSAAQGTPDNLFGFHRFLGAMLRHRFPGTRFEIINAAITAVNSPVVREVATDCARFAPDCFVVYMGNNEMIGPYAGGIPSLPPPLSRAVVRTNLRLRVTRTGQWFADLFRKDAPPADLDGMGLFADRRIPYGSPLIARVHADFKANLEDICRAAEKVDAPILLCTPACNLVDCPPFASVDGPPMSEETRAAFEKALESGKRAASTGNHQKALSEFRAAFEYNYLHAELQYCTAKSFQATGQEEKSPKHFALARDYDALRFRPDTQIAEIIRTVARERAQRGVRLVDTEKAFAGSPLAEQGLPGRRLFYEHVHPTPAGNYLLAANVYEILVRLLPDGIRQGCDDLSPLPETACRQACGLTGWDEYRMAKTITAMVSRPPFTGQYRHAAELAEREQQLAEQARVNTTPQALAAAQSARETALEQEPASPSLRAAYARLLQKRGDLQGAVREWRRVLARFPGEDVWRSELGVALGVLGEPEEALAELERCTPKTMREKADVAFNVASALFKCGRESEALVQFQRTLTIRPDTAEAHANIGAILLRRKQVEPAVGHFRKAIALSPGIASAHNNLGLALAQLGKLDEAIAEFKLALESDGRYASAYRNLEGVLGMRRDRNAAVAMYRRAIADMPDFAFAHYRLGTLLAAQGDTPGATEAFTQAFKLDPRHAENAHNLGVALLKLGKRKEATSKFRHVLRLRPGYEPTVRVMQREGM